MIFYIPFLDKLSYVQKQLIMLKSFTKKGINMNFISSDSQSNYIEEAGKGYLETVS